MKTLSQIRQSDSTANRIAQFLDGKILFITGATGFLGQPLVEKILWTSPGVRRIYVLIRPKRQPSGEVLSAQKRLEKELYESSVFDRLRAAHGAGFLPFLQEKLVAVAGDISQPELGLDSTFRSYLVKNTDVVINSAAVVSFDASLDEALSLNVLGAQRVAEFAVACERAILVHVSTAYVSGADRPDVPETMYHAALPGHGSDPFPKGHFRDIDRDLSHITALVEEIREAAHERRVERELRRAMLLRRAKSPGRQNGGRRKTFEALRQKWIQTRLTKQGMAWARRRGWNDTYTYTKALGEQVVLRARGDMPTVIIRPSVIESSLAEPSPGWLDGLRMADPLIAAIGKGRLRSLPLNPVIALDLVPVDMVVNALLASIPRAAERGGLECYQVATGASNPITLGELYDLIYRYFLKNPMLDKSGEPIRIKRLRFPKRKLFRLQHHLTAMPLGAAERTLDKLSGFSGTQRAKRRISATRASLQKLYYYGEIYEPYLNIDCSFQVENTLRLFRSLNEAEQGAFPFDVTRLNWRHYVQDVHIPGVKKFILKMEGNGRAKVAQQTGHPTTIGDLVTRSAERFGTKPALQIQRHGRWERTTFADLAGAAAEIAQRFRRMGLCKGDRVVLYSENQPEWGAAYVGAVSAGLVVVPLDAQTWQKEVWSVARFTEARALLVSEHCFKRLSADSLRENELLATPFWLLDVNRGCAPFERPELPRSTHVDLSAESEGDVAVPIDPDDPASIIFTTSTASDPKGAVHTHRSFLNNVYGGSRLLPLRDTDRMLSVLPLYHALEFTGGFLSPIYKGATVTYGSSLKPKLILETMRETGTTCMLGVPTLYALIRDDIERRVLHLSRSAFKSNLMTTSKQFSRSVERRTGKQIGRQLFARVHEEFGGQIRFFVSGGSALGAELYEDFMALGMPIYEGYGLTETAPILTLNPLNRSRSGSVGKPLPGVELRLANPNREGVGEIVVKTPSLMREYYRNPEATARAIEGEWLHTGDLGCVDRDGYVYITGRIKDVIVTGAGKNVYPEDLEAIYSTLDEIDEICVLGIKSGLTEEVHACIVPGRALLDVSEPGELKKAMQRPIQQLSKELPSYHRLQQVHVWQQALPRLESGGLDREEVRRQLATRVEARSRDASGAAQPAAASREERLLAELARLSGVPIEAIRSDSDLYTDLGLDSLGAIDLMLQLESLFGVTITDERVDQLRQVGDLLRELEAARHNGTPKRESMCSALPYAERSALDRTLLGLSLSSVKALYGAYFNLQLENTGRVPVDTAYILAANHSSHLDMGAIVAALGSALGDDAAQRLHVLGAKDYFFDQPMKGWFFSTFFNVVPIRREQTGLEGLRMAKSILTRGEPVLLFPEATRSRTGALQPFKPGLGLLALEADVPIVPVHIEGTYRALPKGRRLPRRGDVRVAFGEPISMDRYRGDGAAAIPKDELYRQIAADVRQAIERLSQAAAVPA